MLDDSEQLTPAQLKLDKNNNKLLDADVNFVGEGSYVQGRSFGYVDFDQNGTLNAYDIIANNQKHPEPYAYADFGDLQIEESRLNYFLDLNGDKRQTVPNGNQLGDLLLREYSDPDGQFLTDEDLRVKTQTNASGARLYRFNDADGDGTHQTSEAIILDRTGFLDLNNDNTYTVPGGAGVFNLPRTSANTMSNQARMKPKFSPLDYDDTSPLTIPTEAILTYQIVQDTTGKRYLDRNRDGKVETASCDQPWMW